MDNKIYEENIDYLRNELIGCKVKLLHDLEEGKYYHNLFVNDRMEQYARQDKIFIIRRVFNSYGIGYCCKLLDTDYDYNFDMFEAIFKEAKIKENREYTHFKKGDLVKFRKNEDIEYEEFTPDNFYGIPIKPIPVNIENGGVEFIIQDCIDDRIMPYYLDDEYIEMPISTDIIEIVEENYIGKLKNKKKRNKKENKIIEDFDLIDEMKSKVNIKDFKKIYAGSIKVIPNNLKGIEEVINQWAFNKKELYKLLGKELCIRKYVEYKKDIQAMAQDRQMLYREFPGCCYIIRSLTDEELLENKFSRTYEGYDWLDYSVKQKYNIGDKISKMLDEAFHNDKLNIKYSDIIAQNKIKGYVEISIDPIQILLMSCNVSGWTSCHTIHRIGERGYSFGGYSAGIFSYMCDKHSMIAYRHDGKLYDFRISKQKVQNYSKNWRQMIWIDKDFNKFITSRQYPNSNEEITKTIREILEEKIDKYINNTEKWVHSTNKDKMKSILKDKERKDACILHYNDIRHGFNGDLLYLKKANFKKGILVGSYPVCPNCGKEILENTNAPCCEKCVKTILK